MEAVFNASLKRVKAAIPTFFLLIEAAVNVIKVAVDVAEAMLRGLSQIEDSLKELSVLLVVHAG